VDGNKIKTNADSFPLVSFDGDRLPAQVSTVGCPTAQIRLSITIREYQGGLCDGSGRDRKNVLVVPRGRFPAETSKKEQDCDYATPGFCGERGARFLTGGYE
jgi:hypothetical protein